MDNTQTTILAKRFYLCLFAAVAVIAAIVFFGLDKDVAGAGFLGFASTLLAYVRRGPGHRDELKE